MGSVMPPSNRRKLRSDNAKVHKLRRAVDMLPEFPARDVVNVESPRDKRTYCGIIMFCVLIPAQYLPFNCSLPLDTTEETRNRERTAVSSCFAF